MPQAPRASTPTEVLAGLVERVTFHNDENGFCVLRVKTRGQRDLITVLGHAAVIAAGEFVQASGTWINDRTHGLQFRASFLKAAAPTTIEGIEKYLSSGMIRGIGPIYAKKLVRAFGDTVFDIIEQERGRLREVTGIGPKRAERIVGGWAEQKVIREIMLPQQKHQLAAVHSMTSSARSSTVCGIVRPIVLAVRRLIISSNRVGCSTGRSVGLAPLRIFPA
jgi:ATP-dependent exoDNAse (exonuclease V) alpha subunit